MCERGSSQQFECEREGERILRHATRGQETGKSHLLLRRQRHVRDERFLAELGRETG